MTEGTGSVADVHALQEKLKAAQTRIAELEAQGPADSNKVHPSVESTVDVAPLNEADVTLRRLVQRIAMILQAERIVIMFHDREKGELIGIPPAVGVDDDRLTHFRVRATQGISGEVFRSGEAAIFLDAVSDPRTQKDPFSLLHVHNGITVPLVIEKRDEQNRVIDRTAIGVLHAFNKRHGDEFNDEDVRLLERMAKNAASIIANLQLYREVVEEREELLQTFESLSAGLMLVTADGRVSQMNSTARNMLALEAASLNQPYAEVLAEEKLRAMFANGLAGEEPEPYELHMNHAAAGERVYQVQGALVRNAEGRNLGVVAIMNDITDIKNIEKMKSSFVAMASHELRTPLTAIKGFTSTLLMAEFSPDEQREFLMIIDQECDRLRRLIDDLLNTARIEAGQSLKPSYSEVDYVSLLEKVQKIQQQATSKHRIVLDIQGDIPVIVGDHDKLDQVLTNLLNNAIKYSPDGGDIVIHSKIDGDDVLTGIEDHGLGIPSDQVGKVFEKFHRVNNEDNRKIYGTGLGLFLVRHLVEDVHLGKIWAESDLGKGSTFWFRVPLKLDVEQATKLNDERDHR